MFNLISTKSLSKAEALTILDIAEDMALVEQREVKKLPTLRNQTVVNLFFEDSTRTRISFEVAEKRLSADVINFSAKGSSVSKGESVKDTVLTLGAMGVDAIVIRHSESGTAQTIAESDWTHVPVINAGDGSNEHPTQALLDCFTIRKRMHGKNSRGKDLSGARVLIVGDILHSRVARSNLWLLTTLGAEVRFVAPPTLTPTQGDTWPVVVDGDFDQVLTDFAPTVVMMLRIQHERMDSSLVSNLDEYHRMFGLTRERFISLPETTIVMHPGPMNRGVEISDEAADSAQSAVLEQVTNGIAIRMAVLYVLMTQQSEVSHGA